MKFGFADFFLHAITSLNFVMDNNSTTIAEVNAIVSPNIKKIIDRHYTERFHRIFT